MKREYKLCLSVYDRIILLEIVSKIELNFIVENIINELKKQLAFSDEELYNLDIRSKNRTIIWRTEFDTIKDIFIGEYAYRTIRDALAELKEKEFLEENKELCKKFGV